MPGTEPDYLIVGTVQKPHGIKGELSVRVETDRPGEVFAPGRRVRVGNAAGKPSERVLTVERSRPFKGGVLLKVEGLGWRDEVEDLRGASLLIPREEAAPPAEDEVFYHQLVGMRVEAQSGEVGTVRELYEAPFGFLLGVERPGGKELLIPFVREMVRRVDPEAGLLVIEAPEGLLDL